MFSDECISVPENVFCEIRGDIVLEEGEYDICDTENPGEGVLVKRNEYFAKLPAVSNIELSASQTSELNNTENPSDTVFVKVNEQKIDSPAIHDVTEIGNNVLEDKTNSDKEYQPDSDYTSSNLSASIIQLEKRARSESSLREKSETHLIESEPLISTEDHSHEIVTTGHPTSPAADDKDFDLPKYNRKRKADPSLWKQNVRKKQRMSGQAYVDRKGKTVPQKQPPDILCKCKFKCSVHFPKEKQQEIFKEYWALGDTVLQKAFISSLVEEKPVQRKRKRNEDSGKSKMKSRFYFFRKENGEKVRVCLKFFCDVLKITFKVIDHALANRNQSGAFSGADGRKGKTPPNITPKECIMHVKKHIDRFPRLESHYCRRDTKKLYLSPELNLAEMYRLYCKDYCPQNAITPVKENVYRNIFKSYDPPLATYVPKKDRCTLCKVYYEATDKTALEEKWKEHDKRKKESLEMKANDMKIASTDEENRRTISFDLQAVLSVPYTGDAQIFYRRKLSLYNFTIYECTGEGYCYLWDETQGKKGSSEIGTCLLNYLESLPETVHHVTSYSDTASGQNRNKFIVAAMMYAVSRIDNLQIIDMKYMESGHSYLEADSMHATIERAKKHREIHTPREYGLVIEMARKKKNSYKVHHLEHSDFKDLNNLCKRVLLNTTVDSNGNPVHWLKVKWFRFQKDTPYTVQFKYNLSDETFLEFKILGRRTKPFSWAVVQLHPKYAKRIPVSTNKKKDLLYLLQSGVIPKSYATFYNEIPCERGKMDNVPYTITDDEDDGA